MRMMKILSWVEEFADISVKTREMEVKALYTFARKLMWLSEMALLGYVVGVSNFYG